MKNIPKIDEIGNIIGETTTAEAIENVWLRLVSRVFIFDEKDQILLQKRSATMRTFPNLWDQSAAGHVDVGESSEVAAYRELAEELGLRNVSLTEITHSFRNQHDNERTLDAVYKGIIDSSTKIAFDPGEVHEVKWFTIDTLESAIKEKSQEFVPPFLTVWKHLKEKLIH